MGGGNPRGMVSSPPLPSEARGSFVPVPGGGEVGKGGGGRRARGGGHAGTSVFVPQARCNCELLNILKNLAP